MNFGDNLKKQPSRADGLSRGLLRGRFKQELRNSVCFALLKGNALAAYNQGTKELPTLLNVCGCDKTVCVCMFVCVCLCVCACVCCGCAKVRERERAERERERERER